MKIIIAFLCLLVFATCSQPTATVKSATYYPTIGRVEKFDAELDKVINSDAKAEIIAEGFDWCEGPVWIARQNMLLFSDVPKNTIYKWTEAKGKETWLSPSGYTGTTARGGEMGSNGLTLDRNGKLILAQHGDRRIARLTANLNNAAPQFESIADNYNGKKFNSPNDVIVTSKGELFFTDPPYGLEKQMSDVAKELAYQGVFYVAANGKVAVVTDTLTRPNGLALLPGERTLIVANSDPARPNWYAFDLNDKNEVISSRIFYSMGNYDRTLKGLPDGFKIDKRGYVIASGPGGVYIFNSKGKKLGLLRLENPTSNIALSPDEKTMYITNDMYVLRVKMRN